MNIQAQEPLGALTTILSIKSLKRKSLKVTFKRK
jgi:hypothetical protein